MATSRGWHVAALWLWIAASLPAIYLEGRRLDLDRNVPNRLRDHAVPVAISVLYHGRPHDYTAFRSLALPFQTGDPLDALINHAVTQQPPANDATYYWVADDRGMADYVIGAFYLFGPRTSSLYSFYFIVLGASCLLFLADAGRNPVMNVVLILTLGALYSCLTVIPLAQAYHPFMEPASLFEPRMIELLSYVATLHLAFTVFTDRRWTPLRVVAAIGQTAVLVACYHVRSALAWQVAFVVAVGAANAVWRQVKSSRSRANTQREVMPAGALWSLVPCAMLAAGLLTLQVYKRSAYNPRYFTDMGARTVWHNALMGLGSNEHLRATYRLDINDRDVIGAVIRYRQQAKGNHVAPDWTAEKILNSLGNWAVFNWFDYEDTARDLYSHIWRVDWPSALHCYLVDKPKDITLLGLRVSRAAARSQGIARGVGVSQFSTGAMVIILPALMFVYVRRISLGSAVVGSAGLLLFSTLPALLIYAVVPTMMGTFATLSLLAYAIVAVVLLTFRRAVSTFSVMHDPSA